MVEIFEFYHPVPFKGYDHLTPVIRRKDCPARWEIIREHLGELTGKILLDIGCANGFFCFSFLQEGGRCAIGIDTNEEYVKFNNALASEHHLSFYTYDKSIPNYKFDIGLYLDLHFHGDTENAGYLEYLKENCSLCFISGCQAQRNEELRNKLETLFQSVKVIHKGYADREIFKCL